MDGVYADATWREGPTGIGVVLIRDGMVADRHFAVARTRNNTEAEATAVEWAKSLYPDQSVFCDCQSAAKATGAKWIPRHLNQMAHAAAAHAARYGRQSFIEIEPKAAPEPTQPPQEVSLATRRHRLECKLARRCLKRGVGRGVIRVQQVRPRG